MLYGIDFWNCGVYGRVCYGELLYRSVILIYDLFYGVIVGIDYIFW